MEEPINKKPKLSTTNEDILKQVIKWGELNNINLCDKVTTSSEGTAHRFALIAKADIPANEVLFKIPRTILLSENINSTVASSPLDSESGWVKLVITLMKEYIDPDSKWREYLQLAPSKDTLDLPMFWNNEEQEELLKETQLLENVKKDIKSIENEFTNIALPFIESHTAEAFDPKKHNIELYKLMVAFIMSYSFTEEIEDEISVPFMVPMADILNHVSKNNALLTYGKTHLTIISKCNITKGSEIFNSYGHLSNLQLLQMYGFTEAPGDNIYDFVDIEIEEFKSEASSMKDQFPDLNKRLEYLFGEDGCLQEIKLITFGVEGVLTFENLTVMLNVLTMNNQEFKTYDPDWESDDESTVSDEDEDKLDCLPYKKLQKKFTSTANKLLQNVCKKKHDKLHEQVLKLQAKKLSAPDKTVRRINNVLNLLQSQLNILSNLTNLDNKNLPE